jgi:uncharacterized protein (DUF2336 family)
MTSAPLSDSVSEMMHPRDGSRSGALLRAATENFVRAPRHAAADAVIYEELALQLMRATPLADRVVVARMLAAHPDAPRTLLAALAADEPAVAAPILSGAPHLGDMVLLALVANASPAHLDLVARRPGLSPAVVEALLRALPPDRLPMFLADPAIRIPPAAIADLLAVARDHPGVARALSRREEIDDAELTDLFLDLDDRGRRRVLQALEILALREFAAGRPMTRSERPDEEAVAGLARAAITRDLDRIAADLAGLAGIDKPLARRILDDRGGEPLAIALKAIGLDGATATRVILFSGVDDMRDYFEVKRLVELFEAVSMRSALLLVGRWRAGGGPLPLRVRRHLPQTEAGTPVRARDQAASPATAWPEQAQPRRDSA